MPLHWIPEHSQSNSLSSAEYERGLRVAIKFSGEFEVKKNPESVYDFLTDPKKFAPLLPDFQGMTQQDGTHFTVKVNVGISYIKGVAEVKMQLAEADRPKRAQYKGQGR